MGGAVVAMVVGAVVSWVVGGAVVFAVVAVVGGVVGIRLQLRVENIPVLVVEYPGRHFLQEVWPVNG